MRIFKIDELEIMDNLIYSTANIGQELLDTCLNCPSPIKPVSIRRDTKLGDLLYMKSLLDKYPRIVYKEKEYNYSKHEYEMLFWADLRRIKWAYYDLKVLDLSVYDIACILAMMKYSNLKLSKIMQIIDDDIYSHPEASLYEVDGFYTLRDESNLINHKLYI